MLCFRLTSHHLPASSWLYYTHVAYVLVAKAYTHRKYSRSELGVSIHALNLNSKSMK